MKLKLLLIGAVVALTSLARAGYVPIPITPSSYNADVIVERTLTSLDTNTTATTDGGTNNTGSGWYEIGYNTNNTGSGVPAHGTTFTSQTFGDHSYTMAPDYTVPNAILIDQAVTNGTFTLVPATLVSNLSFLVTSGNGGGSIGCVIHHQDGSVETNIFNAGDWFNGSNPAYTTFGRVGATSGAFDGQASILNPGNPRFYGREIAVTNTTSPVTSVDFKYASGAANVHNQIYAMSGTPPAGGNCVPITVTGYTYDLIVEANAPARTRILATNGAPATSQSMDNDVNGANTFYEQGWIKNFQTKSGLPTQGSLVTNAPKDHVFQFAADYTTNDAIYVNPSNTTTTVTLVTPTPLFGLSILNATGNGPQTIGVVVHHQSSADENLSFVSLDWFNSAGTVLLGTSGRTETDTRALNNLTAPFNPNQAPFLHVADFALNNASDPVTSITFNYTNTTGRTAIFGISGSTGPIPPVITASPVDTNVNLGSPWSLTGSGFAGATTVTYQWQIGTNGVFVNLNPSGNVSGTQNGTLSSTAGILADNADYRLVASTAAGSATTGVATVTVVSPLTAVTKPGDPTSEFNGHSSGGEDQTHAIDNTVTGKYLDTGINNGGGNFVGPVGFSVIPSLGPSVVTGVRLYTANDSQGRDPIDFELYGSTDGNTYTLIASNVVNLPVGRNSAAGALNPLTMFVRQYLFPNTNTYSSYRWTCTRVLTLSGSLMQIGEVEILGVKDTNGRPVITLPAFARAFSNSTASVTAASVNGNPTPTVKWARGSGGVYTLLTNDTQFGGVTTSNLTVANVTAADALDYVLIANNSVSTVTSAPVHLTILSSETDITQVTDPVSHFGDDGEPNDPNDAQNLPLLAFDNIATNPYIATGHGPSAKAGFLPFIGPDGLIITPQFGNSRVNGLRFYTGVNSTTADPTDFALFGSNDGGSTSNLIASGSLSLPDTRASGTNINALTDPMQEVTFANTNYYTTYVIQFTNVKDKDNTANLQIGDIEILGVAPRPTILFDTVSSPGFININIGSGVNGTLQSTTNLQGPATTVWTNVGPINTGVQLPLDTTGSSTFFRVTVP